MDQDLAAPVQGLVDEPVRDAEVLLNVLLWFVVDLQVEVLEVPLALCVGLACHVQDVRHAALDQLARLKRRLERSNVDARVDLEETDVSDGLLAVDITSTEVAVREATADSLLFITRVRLTVILFLGSDLLLVDRWPTNLASLALQLRHRDSVVVGLASNVLVLAVHVASLLLDHFVLSWLLVLDALESITYHLVFVHCVVSLLDNRS